MDHKRTLHVTETINAPMAAVWKALTDKQQIKQYFFGTEAKSSWQPGSPITFTGTWEGQTYEDKGTVLEVEEEKLLRFNYWSSMSGMEDIPENYTIITYQLVPKQGQTHLTVTQQGFRNQEAYEHSVQGWKEVLKNLKSLLETSETV